MAQCYQCGSRVDAADRFCMGCGAEYPARNPAANPAANPAGAPAVPASFTPPAAQPEDSFACPNCATRLPRGAQFCGDCGTRLPNASAAIPAPARPARATAALPDPIPPLNASLGPKPASSAPQTFLPPFRASGWAAQPVPDVALPDDTQTPLSNEHIASSSGQAAPGWASQPAPAPWGAAQPSPWQPGAPQGTSNASSFQPPGIFPPAPAGAPPFQGPPPLAATGNDSPAQAPFLQVMAALPPVKSAPRKRRYPRGEVITMIITAIVTVLAAFGGLILLLLPHK